MASVAGELLVRRMTELDLGAVLSIERTSFSVPWTTGTFLSLLRRRDSHLFVAELESVVVGYAVVWVVLDQAELGDIAVAAAHRRQGVGGRLLAEVFRCVAELGVKELFLEVRVSNEEAQRLYARYGFLQVGRRKNYYTRPREDALVLRRMMGE